MIKKLLKILTSLFLAGCSMVGARTSEEAPFTVLLENGDIQIRQYQELLVAETVIDADYANSGSIGFNRLAGYIFGKNISQDKIAMTSPVFREQDSEKIAMTAPVLQQQTGAKWIMSFVMPADYTLSTLPKPIDPLVSIKQIPGKKVAVLKYSGSINEQMIAEKTNVLTAWLVQNHYQILSKARSAAFDPPWTIPSLRRNEVHIDVE
ncbi:MAG: heme-binding protein [Methylococcaceae bacterium]|nr:heme-binding protein [Methylococcaceae bacterium]MDZ4157000.1 heme-binding protein [Methylococcales bacterium]MDP2392720.1 heme-binding protein [Methylococcaceae bacterium]MDP3018585.1 heme-binding protein [Methylococcaceae bacterium]MDP3391340.1 heme-binding protein [Methylococcaceae bacterium]